MPGGARQFGGKEVSRVRRILNVLKGEEGQSLVEYGLIAALVVVVAIVALTTLGRNITNKLNNVANAIGG